jgi:AcrR family transcriptional regulator
MSPSGPYLDGPDTYRSVTLSRETPHLPEISAPSPDAPLATKRKPERASDKLLGVARRLFYRDGIRAVGVDAIVEAAGVTKPSLYRSFPSKDALAAAYLGAYDRDFWLRFDAAMDAFPGDPRAQILGYFAGIAQRTADPAHRGCGMTNAAVEFPDGGNPARGVCEINKLELRRRLREKAAEMGAADPDILGDGLFLLFEGAHISSQLFATDKPSASIVAVADRLIAASLGAARSV